MPLKIGFKETGLSLTLTGEYDQSIKDAGKVSGALSALTTFTASAGVSLDAKIVKTSLEIAYNATGGVSANITGDSTGVYYSGSYGITKSEVSLRGTLSSPFASGGSVYEIFSAIKEIDLGETEEISKTYIEHFPLIEE